MIDHRLDPPIHPGAQVYRYSQDRWVLCFVCKAQVPGFVRHEIDMEAKISYDDFMLCCWECGSEIRSLVPA